MQISLPRARAILTVTWMVGAGLIILVKILFTERFGLSDNEAWNWLVPNIFPTLSLTISVSIFDAINQSPDNRVISRFALFICMALSIVYLATVFGTLCAVAFSTNAPVEILRSSNIVIGALQAIVVASLAAMFQKTSAPPAPDPGTAPTP